MPIQGNARGAPGGTPLGPPGIGHPAFFLMTSSQYAFLCTQARKDTSENNLEERTGVGASARLLTKASTGGSTLQWRNPEFAAAYKHDMLILPYEVRLIISYMYISMDGSRVVRSSCMKFA